MLNFWGVLQREVLANRLLKHGEFLKLPPLLLEEEKAGGVSGNWSLLDVTQGEARDHQSSEEGDAEMKERSLTDASSSDSAEEDENEEEDDEDDEDESAEEQEAGGIVEVHTTIEHRPPSLGIRKPISKLDTGDRDLSDCQYSLKLLLLPLPKLFPRSSRMLPLSSLLRHPTKSIPSFSDQNQQKTISSKLQARQSPPRVYLVIYQLLRQA